MDTRQKVARGRLLLQDNNFILKGYRIDYSLKDTFRSLFRLHNETGNVWTHLLGKQGLLCGTTWYVTLSILLQSMIQG